MRGKTRRYWEGISKVWIHWGSGQWNIRINGILGGRETIKERVSQSISWKRNLRLRIRGGSGEEKPLPPLPHTPRPAACSSSQMRMAEEGLSLLLYPSLCFSVSLSPSLPHSFSLEPSWVTLSFLTTHFWYYFMLFSLVRLNNYDVHVPWGQMYKERWEDSWPFPGLVRKLTW